VNRQTLQTNPKLDPLPDPGRCTTRATWILLRAVALLAMTSCAVQAQAPASPVPGQADAAQTAAANQAVLPAAVPVAKPAHTATGSEQQRAVKLYLNASRLFEKAQFEEAMRGYQKAAALDPSNPNYALAAEVARGHAVTALIQSAARDRNRGDEPAALAALAHALELDPKNALATEHLHELGDSQFTPRSNSLYEEAAGTVGEGAVLDPSTGVHSFHLHTDQRALIQEVLKAYGIGATVDMSVRSTQLRLDLDDANFTQATHTLAMLTNSFFVPLDAHRVIVARDTREIRLQYSRKELETVYLPGLNQTELADVVNLAKNVFDSPQSVAQQSTGTITISAPQATLNAFNATLRELLDGHSQVLLEVRMIQLAHTSERNTGAQLPQQMSVFNVAAEAQSILNANQSLVQQIVASGLASPGDTLAIIAILLASGQVTSPLLSGGFATFGGGSISTFGLVPGTVTTNLNLNSSDSRALDQIQLRLGDGEEATLRMGERYPIQTSSYSPSISTAGVNIPGLTGAGTSSSLSSLLSSYNAIPPVPQVEYQDLGLTLKTTPKVLRSDEIALTVDLKIDALSGSSLNGNPILNNQAYSGVVTLKEGEGVVVVSELSTSETRAISGTPGISEIPGLNNLTGIDNQKNKSTLLIVMTPHVIRGTQSAGHTPMIHVEKGQNSTR